MQRWDDYFLVSVYKDVTFCLSHYGQSLSHLEFYLFHQYNSYTCSTIDNIALVGFLHRIFDVIKFGTTFSTSIAYSHLSIFQATHNACPFSKILLNAHLFVHYKEREVYKI